jgi:hypothetical protein
MLLGQSGTGAPAMSIIPLHLQRRFEQRWAARFGSLVIPGHAKESRIERLAGQNAPRAAKAKEKPAGPRLKAQGK